LPKDPQEMMDAQLQRALIEKSEAGGFLLLGKKKRTAVRISDP